MFLGKYFKTREELDLLEGSIDSSLFHLSLPLIITFVLQSAYNLVDTFWVGQLSTDALAGITFSFPLVFLFISLGSGVSITGAILVAQFEGSGKGKKVNHAASQALSFAILAAIFIGSIGMLFVKDIIGFMGASTSVVPLAVSYMQVILSGLVFMFGFFTFNSLMRGWGDTVTPMLLMIGSVLVNLVIDPFLIFGWWIFPRLGIQGAAVATVFSRGLIAVTGFYLLYSGRYGLQLKPEYLVPDLQFFKKILSLGVPASIDQTARALGVNALLVIVGGFSTAVVAGFGISIRIFLMIFLPAVGVAQATSTIVGQNIGAGNRQRAVQTGKNSAKYTFIVLTLLGIVMLIFAEGIASIFTKDPAVVRHAADMLRISALTFGGIGAMRSFSGVFRGAGNTRIAMMVTVLTVWVFRLPVAWGLSLFVAETGIWLSFALANVFGAAVAAVAFYRFDWARNLAN